MGAGQYPNRKEVGPEFADVPDVVARLQQRYDLDAQPSAAGLRMTKRRRRTCDARF